MNCQHWVDEFSTLWKFLMPTWFELSRTWSPHCMSRWNLHLWLVRIPMRPSELCWSFAIQTSLHFKTHLHVTKFPFVSGLTRDQVWFLSKVDISSSIARIHFSEVLPYWLLWVEKIHHELQSSPPTQQVLDNSDEQSFDETGKEKRKWSWNDQSMMQW